MEVEGGRCLRREQDRIGNDRKFTKQNAKEECSKNKRCVGIEFAGVDDNYERFKLCLDSIYKSTAWDKYEKLTNLVFKKAHNYGKYVVNEAT